uniref:Uncharacterized protein n=1 Tax=Opuntia streptacantha TaxID=393608 RepID=A0A7C9AN56_OPUST
MAVTPKRSSGTRSLSYKAEISEFPFANTISTKSIVTLKKGHMLYISLSKLRFRGSFSITYLNAAPKPSHTGRWNRVWVHAKIQGIARSDSIPPLGFLFDGRLPMFMRPYSVSGVTCNRK